LLHKIFTCVVVYKYVQTNYENSSNKIENFITQKDNFHTWNWYKSFLH